MIEGEEADRSQFDDISAQRKLRPEVEATRQLEASSLRSTFRASGTNTIKRKYERNVMCICILYILMFIKIF